MISIDLSVLLSLSNLDECHAPLALTKTPSQIVNLSMQSSRFLFFLFFTVGVAGYA